MTPHPAYKPTGLSGLPQILEVWENISAEGELQENSVVSKMETTQVFLDDF